MTQRRPLQALAGQALEAHVREQKVDACETRCLCGSLLARLVEDKVELKCRRCKRITLIPLLAAKSEWPAE